MPRVAFFGMNSPYSVRPLLGLLQDGVEVALCVKPLGGIQTRGRTYLKRDFGLAQKALSAVMPGAEFRDPFVVARRQKIPTYFVGNASSDVFVELLKKERIDLVVVAFFNQLLKPNVLDALSLGGLNAHPSLLPKYRGASPLFWAFRDGQKRTGVTIHRLLPGEDDGDIAAAQSIPVPLGMRGEELVDALAAVNASLLPKAVGALLNGTARFAPQDQNAITRAPRPKEADCLLLPSMGAGRLYGFVRGVATWNALYYQSRDERLRIVDAIAYEEGGTMPGDDARLGETLMLACPDGTVTLRLG